MGSSVLLSAASTSRIRACLLDIMCCLSLYYLYISASAAINKDIDNIDRSSRRDSYSVLTINIVFDTRLLFVDPLEIIILPRKHSRALP